MLNKYYFGHVQNWYEEGLGGSKNRSLGQTLQFYKFFINAKKLSWPNPPHNFKF